jgi:hypothetical protein
MRTPAAMIPLVAATALTWIAISSDGIAQGPDRPRSWAHAYVHGDGADLYVTYVEGTGCRDQKIEISASRGFGLDAAAKYLLAAAMAVNVLGSRGYEMIAEGRAYCHDNRTAIHFKRGNY